jgi:hypothetical protein
VYPYLLTVDDDGRPDSCEGVDGSDVFSVVSAFEG